MYSCVVRTSFELFTKIKPDFLRDGKASEEAYNRGGWLIFKDILNEWVSIPTSKTLKKASKGVSVYKSCVIFVVIHKIKKNCTVKTSVLYTFFITKEISIK